MVRSAKIPGRPCSVAASLQLVGDRWSLLALREILFGNRRFSQIARNTGAPRDRLAARLKNLLADGIVERREYQAARFEYHLTDAGKDLYSVLTAFIAWGDRWAVDQPSLFLEHYGHRLEAVTTCAGCGQPVDPDALHMVSQAPGWSLSGPDKEANA
ncbi:winged helix-turn-helix transcriptional regulator [Streptomyces sp. NPDC090080]|uniref:winged helix-turn-helix transcriptional regulator n=1 Tax=Streptomyces sp. NPDC090080 TaxID=3365939 RepID=UPI003830148F